jgi:HPt (histidine-containing phosphotransfer) domain-containing protein
MNNIDMKRIDDIFGDNVEAARNFMRSVIDNTEKLLSEIQQMINDNEIKASKDALHRLKGSAANCGLTQLHLLAVDAEKMLLVEDWSAVNEIFKRMLTEFDVVKVEAMAVFKL